jgi:hypothetical protein
LTTGLMGCSGSCSLISPCLYTHNGDGSF